MLSGENESASEVEYDPLSPEIRDNEIILRAIKASYHFDKRKNKIKKEAYKPRAGASIISVMRQDAGDDHCKTQALASFPNEYLGFGAHLAGKIRETGSKVLDAPVDYYGHAHVQHPIAVPVQLPDDEPPSPEIVKEINDHCKKLADSAKWCEDPDPLGMGWTALAITIP